MVNKLSKSKALLLFHTAILLSSCGMQTKIISASSHEVGDNEQVEVELKSRDISTIKGREIYFSMVLKDCNVFSKEYPIEPYIDGQRASGFKFSVQAEVMKIIGKVPKNIFKSFSKPCIQLRGGSYLRAKLTSTTAPVIKSRL